MAQLIKDLESGCLYNKVIALNAVLDLINKSNAPAFAEVLMKLSRHPQGAVRKKSLHALFKAQKFMEDFKPDLIELLKESLRDQDMQVLGLGV